MLLRNRSLSIRCMRADQLLWRRLIDLKKSSTLKGKGPLPPPHSKAKMQQRGEARERFQQLSASTTKAVETIKRSRPANGLSSASPPGDPQQPATPLADIRHDVLVHAESLAKEVTALTLAVKPPATVEAVVAELDKLGGIVAKLSYVVELLPTAGAMTKRLRYVCRCRYQPLRTDHSELTG